MELLVVVVVVLVLVPDVEFDTEEEFTAELSPSDGALVLPKKVLDSVEEPTGFAGYVGGPKEGELEEELDDLLEEDVLELDGVFEDVLEDTEELPPGSLSEEEDVSVLSGGRSGDVYSDILPGSSDPETYELFASITLPSPSLLCEHPAKMQIAAKIEITPLILFFIIHSPNF